MGCNMMSFGGFLAECLPCSYPSEGIHSGNIMKYYQSENITTITQHDVSQLACLTQSDTVLLEEKNRFTKSTIAEGAIKIVLILYIFRLSHWPFHILSFE